MIKERLVDPRGEGIRQGDTSLERTRGNHKRYLINLSGAKGTTCMEQKHSLSCCPGHRRVKKVDGLDQKGSWVTRKR